MTSPTTNVRSKVAATTSLHRPVADVIGTSVHVCVCADTDRDLIALVVMTAEMQHLAQRFSDVLVIDATYKTNVHHMPLNSAMIINAEGHGQVICHARRLQLCSHGWPS